MAFLKLNAADMQDIILAVGNTGSGKTTMFNSLIHGSESLDDTKKDFQIRHSITGKVKTKK